MRPAEVQAGITLGVFESVNGSERSNDVCAASRQWFVRAKHIAERAPDR